MGQTTRNFDPPLIPQEVVAIKTHEKIVVDGKLQEASWKLTTPITNFFAMEPRQGEEIQNPTTVRILFDDENLYIGAFCQDSLGKKLKS